MCYVYSWIWIDVHWLDGFEAWCFAEGEGLFGLGFVVEGWVYLLEGGDWVDAKLLFH